MKLLLFVIYKSYIFQTITAINIVMFVGQYFINIVVVFKIYL